MKRPILALAACLLSPACSMSPSTVTKGQLFCARATVAGPLVVAVADALGAPLIVTNQAAETVAAWCRLAQAIPVSPPTTVVPVVAVPIIPPSDGKAP